MTTRLDIINAMLAVNGEAPVSSADSTDPAAVQASNALKLVDRKVQARGWWFNREFPTLLPLAGTGEIVLPQNTLEVDTLNVTSPYVQRGTRLYNRNDSTYNIGVDVRVDITLLLEISELPEAAGSYIMTKAVKEYYEDDDGDADKANRLNQRESEAYAFLQRAHLANSDVNIRTSLMGRQLTAGANSSNALQVAGEFT